jgi:drug/metabolite transporter (DMT)-like permease
LDPERPRRFTPMLMLLATAFFWSLGGLLIKWVSWNPVAIAGMRSLIAALFLILVMGWPRFEWSVPLVLGALAYAATVILFVIGNKLTVAANVIVLQYTAPVYIALMSHYFLGEKINQWDWLTIFAVIGGMVLFFLDKLTPGNMIGNLCGVISGLTFGTLIICLRKQKDAAPQSSVILGNLLTALIGIPFMFGAPPDIKGWTGLLFLGVVQLGMSYWIYTRAIQRVTALQGILIPVLEPILNPLWVLLFFGEVPGKWALIGGTVILGSVTGRYAAPAIKNGMERAEGVL